MKNCFTLLAVVVMLACGKISRAQDIHFSQIHASPTFLNPAMTGIFEGDYRVIANFRQQWRNTTANYRTVALAADFKIMDFSEAGFLSLGSNVWADRAGDLDYTTGSAAFNIGWVKGLGSSGRHFVSLSLQGAVLHHSLNYEKLYVFDDEPLVTDGSAVSRRSVMDGGLGIAWYKALGKDNMIYTGTAIFHIAEPNISMLGYESGAVEPLRRKYVWHAGGEIKLNDKFDLMPSYIIMEQVPNREITIGTFIRYSERKRIHRRDTDAQLYFGGWFRWFARTDIRTRSDAAVFSARLDKNRVSYSLSYDVNVSTLTRATKGVGGPELSVIYRGETNFTRNQTRNRRGKIDCPKF